MITAIMTHGEGGDGSDARWGVFSHGSGRGGWEGGIEEVGVEEGGIEEGMRHTLQ